MPLSHRRRRQGSAPRRAVGRTPRVPLGSPWAPRRLGTGRTSGTRALSGAVSPRAAMGARPVRSPTALTSRHRQHDRHPTAGVSSAPSRRRPTSHRGGRIAAAKRGEHLSYVRSRRRGEAHELREQDRQQGRGSRRQGQGPRRWTPPATGSCRPKARRTRPRATSSRPARRSRTPSRADPLGTPPCRGSRSGGPDCLAFCHNGTRARGWRARPHHAEEQRMTDQAAPSLDARRLHRPRQPDERARAQPLHRRLAGVRRRRCRGRGRSWWSPRTGTSTRPR